MKTNKNKPIRKQEIVINCMYGGFSLSREAFLELRKLGCKEALEEPDTGPVPKKGPKKFIADCFLMDIPRDNPLLVAVVKKDPVWASGCLASLKVIAIPADVKWHIERVDGWESIHEEHRVWP